MKDWKEFDRFGHGVDLDFYGCVDANGDWFDSAKHFTTAVHWCCYSAGEYELDTVDEIELMNDKGSKLGYSVIRGVMIKKMYEQGLIK